MNDQEEFEKSHWYTGPATLSYEPPEYSTPAEGPATVIVLRTPEQEAVGSLVYNEDGIAFEFSETASPEAQEYGAEIVRVLRSNVVEGLTIQETVDMVKEAYVGDFEESLGAWPLASKEELAYNQEYLVAFAKQIGTTVTEAQRRLLR